MNPETICRTRQLSGHFRSNCEGNSYIASNLVANLAHEPCRLRYIRYQPVLLQILAQQTGSERNAVRISIPAHRASAVARIGGKEYKPCRVCSSELRVKSRGTVEMRGMTRLRSPLTFSLQPADSSTLPSSDQGRQSGK